ncbi:MULTISPECIES: DUF2933 domain-containing protein [Aeromonas]|jgi:hypothetical protein|uniref:DUF2933 domain protein n=2 Tax=Aeromonas TaxID=642 RepID=T0PJH0_AERSA|nr:MULTISPECIES: DUF2933 domain-containing protein [Aeromonas]ATP08131.1 DUF2933 domain protein [Aeromonas salmonicida subsp. pectinolytica 34mel]EQC02891.1 hypothetical protein K931_18212 [Aeromonas salmonicida subsp. pectinolytica 34mel]MCF5770170.1 DUF2933 domain-containing protein [Aeromonas veronii]MCF5875173.1 DUF2933 domain-containing protein [Aeromonas veronii]MDM5076379.1 DUF2933 domain-containing protein [Aeromonas media]
MNSHHEHNQSDEPGFWRSRTGVAFIIIGSVAGYFLVTEHWAHFMGALPYLLLLACPLMHVFMHGGHGDNHENGDHGSDEKKQNIQKSSPDQNDKSDKGESL